MSKHGHAYYTFEEAGAAIGLSRQQVYNLVEAGLLKVKDKAPTVITRKTIDRFLRERRRWRGKGRGRGR